MTLAGWAAVTTRHARASWSPPTRSGTLRCWSRWSRPSTTCRGGRAAFGLGAGWYEPEHRAFGIDMGASIAERLDRLDEAALLVRDLLRDGHATARGRHYHGCRCGQRSTAHPGSASRCSSAAVASGEPWPPWRGTPTRGTPAVTSRRCAGRTECSANGASGWAATSPTSGAPSGSGRSSSARRSRRHGALPTHHRRKHRTGGRCPGRSVRAHRGAAPPFVELGFRTIHFDVPAPFDRETLERMAGEVRRPPWPGWSEHGHQLARRTLEMIGNAHIDPVWLWRWEEGFPEARPLSARRWTA